MDIQKIKSLLVPGKNIVITTHKSPDGDAIGSSLGLHNLLISKNINSTVIVPNEFPDFLHWIKNTESIVVVDNQPEEAKKIVENADVVFCLDFNALHRIDELGEWVGARVGENDCFKVMIDHHQEPEEFADITISDVTKSSTCEMIYDFIESLGWENEITPEIGEAIYTGIVTDTGSFKHKGTTARSHEVAAKLIGIGVDNSKIHQIIFDSNKISRLKVLGRCLNNMEFIPELECAIFCVSNEDMEELQIQKGDTEGIVNFGLSVKEVQCAVIFKEDGDRVKLSVRSKGDFNVSLFAKTYFEGGGHINAAGGINFDNLENTVKKFKTSLKEYKENNG